MSVTAVSDTGMIQYTLNTGQRMPALGLGTWQSEKGALSDAIETAIDAGYRHIDGALAYLNEVEVGRGIAAKIQDGTVTRDELFVTSKLWMTYMRPDVVSHAITKTLSDLQLDYVDLYLMHFPMALKPDLSTLIPTEPDGSCSIIDVDYLDTYKEMEKLVEQGKVKAIGISNFNVSQVQRLVDNCRIKPAVNQIESHPYLPEKELIDKCVALGIHVSAYSPLGSPGTNKYWATANKEKLLQNSTVCEIGKKYNKSPAQVLIRYPIQRGLSVLVKSVRPQRINENAQVMDFELSAEDVFKLDQLSCGERANPVLEIKHSKYYPF